MQPIVAPKKPDPKNSSELILCTNEESKELRPEDTDLRTLRERLLATRLELN